MVVDKYAYSLSQDELGWRWRLYDEDGEVVGAGRKATQAAAEAEVKHAIAVVGCSGATKADLTAKRLVDAPSLGASAAVGVFAADR